MDTERHAQLALFGIGGFVLGVAAQFVHLNISTIEQMAAEASGFSRWSLWSLPFCWPGGMIGAALAVLLGSALSFRHLER